MPVQPRLIKEEQSAYTVDEDAKAAYRERLRRYLQDPAFRQIEGFPLGEDEAILALSDPPYYTACPNPFLPEIVAQWQAERAALRKRLGLDVGQAVSLPGQEGGQTDSLSYKGGQTDSLSYEGGQTDSLSYKGGQADSLSYGREPFAADVSEGKNDPIYNAHSYHTKVPHKAIMRYILHYTDPGDIVFDGFCGTGMTGVAAQLCGDRKAVADLGYFVDDEGYVYEAAVGQTDSLPYRSQGAISRLGARKAVLNDLSPAATFIAYNYNTPVDTAAFEQEAQRILDEVEAELGWMYETHYAQTNQENRANCIIQFTVWSDVFVCQECSNEIVFWDRAVDKVKGKVHTEFTCPNCQTRITKSNLDRAWQIVFDESIGQVIQQAKQIPVLINCTVGKKRLEKPVDQYDLEVLERAKALQIKDWFPTTRMPEGDESRRNDRAGFTHLHHFYTPQNIIALAALWSRIDSVSDKRIRNALRLVATAIMPNSSKMRRFRADGKGGGPLPGTLYMSSLTTPLNVLVSFKRNYERIAYALRATKANNSTSVTTTQSATLFRIQPESMDYIFVDPPFGSNLMYSELNSLWEPWLKVITNTIKEAIVNKTQQKGLLDYQRLMEEAFHAFQIALKPGRWLTVEFHNSQNGVWTAIQEALNRAGMVVADVRTLDKKQGTFKQVTADGAVKRDLIISAYKPHIDFEKRFSEGAGSEEGAWAFVRQHLAQLPVVVAREGVIETLSERQDYLLFDRMVAFHIQRGASVPLSASEFYAGLRRRFIERDGMFFLPDQAPAYDKARLEAGSVAQLALFVSDEKSSIQWLRQRLAPEFGGYPQTYQELQPSFLKQLHQLPHEALPELSDLLEQNFLQDEEGRWYLPDPNKASDLEKLRQRALLREFNGYREGRKRLKQFRTEAIRAGFAQAWGDRAYGVIVQVAERLPESVLQEDPDLLMYYDNASLLL